MNDESECRQLALQFAQQQLVAQYLAWWQDFRETERRKSALLPVLWGHRGYAQNDEAGIVHEILRRHRPPPGSRGLLGAFGPGFGAELLLLEFA